MGDGDVKVGKQAAIGLHESCLADSRASLAGSGVLGIFGETEGGNARTNRAGGNEQAAVTGMNQAGELLAVVVYRKNAQAIADMLLRMHGRKEASDAA